MNTRFDRKSTMLMNSKYISLFFALSLLATGCVDRKAQESAKKTEAIVRDKSVAVQVSTPVQMALAETMDLTGTISTDQQVQLGAETAGRITAMYVRDGDTVSQGQVIARQDTSDSLRRLRQAMASAASAREQLNTALANSKAAPVKSDSGVRSSIAQLNQAKENLARLRRGDRPEQRKQIQAQVNAAKSNLETAKKDLERFRVLFREGAVSRQEVDRLENAYAAALSNYEQVLEVQRMQQTGPRVEDIAVAESQVRMAEEALRSARANQSLDVQYQYQINSAKANLESAEEQVAIAREAVDRGAIRSPISGRISGQPLKVGAYAGPGTPVAVVIGSQGVFFEAEVPESRVASVQPGLYVVVRLDAIPGKTFPGRTISVSPAGDQVGRLFKARISIQAGGALVRPGMFARGELQMRVIEGALTLPLSALQTDSKGSYVLVVANGEAKRVDITTGLRKKDRVEVIGLGAEEQVITNGQMGLLPGTKVKVEGAAAKGQ